MVENFKPPEANNSWSTNGEWNIADGWGGLIPGRTSLSEVKSKFGEPDGCWRSANATFYYFCAKSLEFAVLDYDKNCTIAKVRIMADCQHQPNIPKTIEEAEHIFGNLKISSGERSCDANMIFERPGLRLACEPGNPPRVKWLEFYPVISA